MKKYNSEIQSLKKKGIKNTDDVPIDKLIDIAKLYYNESQERTVILKKIDEILEEMKKEHSEFLERFLREQVLEDFIEETNELLKE